MTFKKSWFKNQIKSTEGYTVSIKNRASILYVDPRLKVIVSAEMDLVPKQWVYMDKMWLDEALEHPITDPAEEQFILGRVKDAFASQGWNLIS